MDIGVGEGVEDDLISLTPFSTTELKSGFQLNP